MGDSFDLVNDHDEFQQTNQEILYKGLNLNENEMIKRSQVYRYIFFIKYNKQLIKKKVKKINLFFFYNYWLNVSLIDN